MSWLRRLREPSTVIGLGCLLLLCSASVYNLWFVDNLTGTNYHRNQTIWLVLGLLGGGVIAGMDIAFFRRFSSTLYQLLVVLLVVVLAFGREINHSRRWLELGPVNLQPSEFMKLSMVLVLADWFDRKRGNIDWSIRHLLIPLGLLVLPVILINRQPDLGTSVCVALIGGSVILYEGVRKQTLVASLLLVMMAIPLAWRLDVVHSYQKRRVEAWLVLDEDAVISRRTARASQAEQALWAVGSGQWTGRDKAEAKRSVLRHLPFLHTDFVLASWAQVFGLVGTMGLFLLYGGVMWWALQLANRARDRFDALLAVGVASLVFWQFFINAGMVIGLLPVVGMTLPLMSYGGSSALTVLLGCGFLLNIALRRRTRLR